VFEAQLSTDPDKRWKTVPEIVEHLKAKARKLGLWNLWLSDHDGGAGFTNLEYGLMCEILGRSLLSREALNCSAPDTGNMEVGIIWKLNLQFILTTSRFLRSTAPKNKRGNGYSHCLMERSDRRT